MNSAHLLDQALGLHQCGNHEAAARVYAAVLEQDPLNSAALRLLGVLRSQSGDFDEAIMLLQAAARFTPSVPELYNDLGNALRGKGAHQEAVEAFACALRLSAAYPDALFNLGCTLETLGRDTEAAEAYTQALQCDSSAVEARFNLAMLRTRQGRDEEAYKDLVLVRKRKPELRQSQVAFGTLCERLGKWQEAGSAYTILLRMEPASAEWHVRSGVVQMALGEMETARAAFHRAIVLDPHAAEAHYRLGLLATQAWCFDEAIVSIETARRLRPDRPEVYTALGTALQRLGKYAEAQASFEEALRLDPESADAHWRLADLLLLQGDYPRGWREFEWRWKHDGFLTKKQDFLGPAWDGEDPSGRTILLHAEQGFGDTLQFVRYAPMLAAQGARVVLGSPPELQRLLASVPGVDAVYSSRKDLPPFDAHVPLLSLPYIMGTTLESIPGNVPYLYPDPELTSSWSHRLGPCQGRMRIGLIWSGNPSQEHNRHRACHLEDLAPLGAIDSVTYFSLQKGDPARELSAPPRGLEIRDLSAWLTDFSETAAALENMDLVISTDTGPVHLAGALGKPVWLLLSAAPDWRWLTARSDSPWYPSMRLFRQTRLGRWDDVVAEVAQCLRTLACSHGQEQA